MDLRPVAGTGYEGLLTISSSSYPGYRTKHLITHHLKTHLNINVIFFNDSQIDASLSYVQYRPNHHNHLHVRIY